jgi:hypothetical protein
MSQVMAAPELIAAAATDVSAVGSSLDAAHLAAAAPTVAVIPAAADEISAGIAHLFSQHAQNYQALAAQASAFNQQFAQHMTSSAHAYVAAEAANAASLSAAAPAASTPSDLGTEALTAITDWLTSTINHVIANAVALINNTILLLDQTVGLFYDAGNLTFGYLYVTYLLLGMTILKIEPQLYRLFGILKPYTWPLPRI